jgi:hypothetical protein
MSLWGQHLSGAAASSSEAAARSLAARDPRAPAAEGSPAAATAAAGTAPGSLAAVLRQQETGRCPAAAGNAAAAVAARRLRSPAGHPQRRRPAMGPSKQRLQGLQAGEPSPVHLPPMAMQLQVAASSQPPLTMARQQQQPTASSRERWRLSRGARPVLLAQPPMSTVSRGTCGALDLLSESIKG